MSTSIPFIDLQAQRERLEPQLSQSLAALLKDGRFVLGPEVEALESELADFCGAKHCITCANGTDALLLIMLALGIGSGDAVIVPDFTFIATAESVAMVGASPIFVDVEKDTFMLNPRLLLSALEVASRKKLKPKVLIAVDLFGQPDDYQALQAFCSEHNLFLIADAAQSFGAKYQQQSVGTLGDATAVSFFPSKPLGCYGDGGAVFTQDHDLAQKLRSLRQHGQGSHRYEHCYIGLNSRLDSIQAVILRQKLSIFPEELQRRQQIAQRYQQALGGVVSTPQLKADRSSTWAQYTIISDQRDKIAIASQQQNIPTAIYYPIPFHRQPAYQHFSHISGETNITVALTQQVISLPMHAYLNPDIQDLITNTILGALS